MADGAGPVPGTSARRLVPGSASLTKAQVGGTVVCVKTRRSEAARRRWEGSTEAERRTATEPMRQAERQRRRTATALLAAVEAAGLRVELTDDREDTP